MAVIHKLIKSYCPFWLRFWLNCGLRSITFGGMQHCHSNLTLIKHYKIQAKFVFGGNSPIFDWVLALFWLRFRPMQKLNITFLQNYYILQLITIGSDYPVPVDKHNPWLKIYRPSPRGIKGQICKFHNNSVSCHYFLQKCRMQTELQ